MDKKKPIGQRILNIVQDESPLMSTVGAVFTFVLLNVCTLVCMVPVITGGAALTALYDVLLQRSGWNYVTACKQFFKSFRQKLAASLLPWVLTLAAAGGVLAAWKIVLEQGLTNQFALMLPLLLASIVILFTVLWLYPLMAAAALPWRQAIPAAFVLGLKELGHSALLLVLEAILVLFALYCSTASLSWLGLWLLCGLAPLEGLKLRVIAGKLPRKAP